MAHSRTSTVRSHSSASTVALNPSPLPKSPARHSHYERPAYERPAHQRRKSGQLAGSEKKASRPAPLNRRTTPQFTTKVGAGWSGAKNMGKADRDSRHFEEDFRLNGEGFLQYCPSCEKQINPSESFSILYCSEVCRKQDLQPAAYTATSYNPTYHSSFSQCSSPISPYSRYTHCDPVDAGPDIIPQFSPTQATSRRSYFQSASLPHPTADSPPSPNSAYLYQYPVTTAASAATRKTTKRHSGSSTALESLRELAVALPATRDGRRNSRDKDRKREYSPSISTTASISSPPTPVSHSATGVWNYLPRTLSMASLYARDIVSASQAERYPGAGGSTGNSYSNDYQYAVTKSQFLPQVSLGMDRPLPPRSGGYGFGGRPRSVDLVTPISYSEN